MYNIETRLKDGWMCIDLDRKGSKLVYDTMASAVEKLDFWFATMRHLYPDSKTQFRIVKHRG